MAGARTSGTQAESLYGVSPGVAMMQKWIAGLKEKTGRTLEEWVSLIQKEGPKDEKARKEWLKTSTSSERTAPGFWRSAPMGEEMKRIHRRNT